MPVRRPPDHAEPHGRRPAQVEAVTPFPRGELAEPLWRLIGEFPPRQVRLVRDHLQRLAEFLVQESGLQVRVAAEQCFRRRAQPARVERPADRQHKLHYVGIGCGTRPQVLEEQAALQRRERKNLAE